MEAMFVRVGRRPDRLRHRVSDGSGGGGIRLSAAVSFLKHGSESGRVKSEYERAGELRGRERDLHACEVRTWEGPGCRSAAMKKRMINPAPRSEGEPVDADWLRLDELVEVEITSESAAHPIEAALRGDGGLGWRADAPGAQIIRLCFEKPRTIRRVRVVIEERERERTQEFVLRAAAATGGPWRELARQQFNFSPSGATREQEDYGVNLPVVAALELAIVPDIGGGDAFASLQQMRVA